MSRIGRIPVKKPDGIEIQVKEKEVLVKGKKGELRVPIFPGIKIAEKEGKIYVKNSNLTKQGKAFHGLVRALLKNAVEGLTKGFQKTLLLEGIGYRAQKKGKEIVLSLGFSHPVIYKEPEDVQIEVPEPTKIIVSGIDKQRVGQVAAEIRALKPPEPYKGKGIRYEGEYVRRKAGKALKK